MNEQRTAYDLGRLYEARYLAAQGAAIGYFAPNAVWTWLSQTSERVEDFASRFADFIEAHGTRVPPYLDVESMRTLAGSYVGDTTSDQSRFQQILILRHHLDTESDARRYYEAVLFDKNSTWQRNLAQIRAEIEAVLPVGDIDDLSYPTTAFIDGAFRSPILCTEFLEQLVVGEPVPSPWQPSQRDRTHFSSVAMPLIGLNKMESPARYVEAAILTAQSADASVKIGALRMISEVFGAKLVDWAAQTNRDSAPLDSVLHDARDIYSVVSLKQEGPLSCSLGPQVGWGCMLWRLAPTDESCRERNAEALAVVDELSSELDIWRS